MGKKLLPKCICWWNWPQVSISSTFYLRFFVRKCFSLIYVRLCSFLAKVYLRKSCLWNFGVIDYRQSPSGPNCNSGPPSTASSQVLTDRIFKIYQYFNCDYIIDFWKDLRLEILRSENRSYIISHLMQSLLYHNNTVTKILEILLQKFSECLHRS